MWGRPTVNHPWALFTDTAAAQCPDPRPKPFAALHGGARRAKRAASERDVFSSAVRGRRRRGFRLGCRWLGRPITFGGAEELHLVGDDLDGLSLLATVARPLTPLQTSVNRNATSATLDSGWRSRPGLPRP